MKTALVYDRVNKWGGAERVLLALHELWPDAPLFTAVYDDAQAPWARDFDVRPSFLQRLPHELVAWVTPIAFETFDFSKYDAVISITSAEAKNIRTKPHTMHLCYCLTPTRYLWSARAQYERQGILGIGLQVMGSPLRAWDLVASTRPDYFVAISNIVKSRIERYYRREVSDVINPPVDLDGVHDLDTDKGYYLVVSRLVPYKRVDLIVKAFNFLEWPLVIVGDGSQKRDLMRVAKKNITFTGEVSDAALVKYYRQCRAFVHAGVEDFGIAAVEAQLAGKPVIAFGEGGMREIVLPGKTGELFFPQNQESLIRVLENFSRRWYDSRSCMVNAQRFSRMRFQQKMKHTVESLYNEYRERMNL